MSITIAQFFLMEWLRETKTEKLKKKKLPLYPFYYKALPGLGSSIQGNISSAVSPLTKAELFFNAKIKKHAMCPVCYYYYL